MCYQKNRVLNSRAHWKWSLDYCWFPVGWQCQLAGEPGVGAQSWLDQTNQYGEGSLVCCWFLRNAQGSFCSVGGVPELCSCTWWSSAGVFPLSCCPTSLGEACDWLSRHPGSQGSQAQDVRASHYQPLRPCPIWLGQAGPVWQSAGLGFDLWSLSSLSSASGRPVPPELWNTTLNTGSVGSGLARNPHLV